MRRWVQIASLLLVGVVAGAQPPSTEWLADQTQAERIRAIESGVAATVPGEAQPRLLPEVLTPALVLAEVGRLPAAKPTTAITQN